MAKTNPGVTFPSEQSRRIGFLATEEQATAQIEKWLDEDHEKLLLLCRNFGIKEGAEMWYQLALTLARELYPKPKKPGAKTKWGIYERAVLVVEVERMAKPDDPSHGIEWACRQLAKREPWKSLVSKKSRSTLGPDPAEALRRKYFDARGDRSAQIARDAFKWHEVQGTIRAWEEEEVKYWVKNPPPI